MNADALLGLLDKVKATGRGRWQSRCPAHDDNAPSLSIRELDDGRVLIHCFAGCPTVEVLDALGLSTGALFPERLGHDEHHLPRESRPFPAADVLRAIAFEAVVIATIGAAIDSCKPVSQQDRERLMIAVGRVQAALTAGGLDRE